MKTMPEKKSLTTVGSAAFAVGSGVQDAPGSGERAGGSALSIPHSQRQVYASSQLPQAGQRLNGGSNEFHVSDVSGPAPMTIPQGSTNVPTR